MRADDWKKPRPSCRWCQREQTKAWRQRVWQRRKAYDTWRGMIRRCHDPRTRRWWPGTGVPSFRDYGERGIKVCRRWRDKKTGFAAFLEDLGYPPTPTHELDRRRGGTSSYRPSNCRWVTKDEQNRNRRGVRVIEAACAECGDVHTYCCAEWDRHLGLKPGTVGRRVRSGQSPESAVASAAPAQYELAEAAPF